MEQTARDKRTGNVIATKKQIRQLKYIPMQSHYALRGQHSGKFSFSLRRNFLVMLQEFRIEYCDCQVIEGDFSL